jgi:hypothetical protein
MSLKRVKNNMGFLIAGVVVFTVAINIYFEIGNTNSKEPTCQSISTQ